MAKRLEDVLQQRRERRELCNRLLHCQDQIASLMRLLHVLENACTAVEIPEEFHVNADLATLIWRDLEDLELGLRGVQQTLRQMP